MNPEQVEVVVADPLMNAEEARQCIDHIKSYLQSIRKLLLELEQREGWLALGYKSMRQCMLAEFPKSKSQLYRELQAGRVERVLSPMGDNLGEIPERQLREISKLPENKWREAWEQVQATAPPKGITTSHVARTVSQIKAVVENEVSDFSLGDWVKVENPESEFYGKQGAVVKIEKEQITILIDEEEAQFLVFKPHELQKISVPNHELNQAVKETWQCGDIVIIDCPKSAEIEQRIYNGCWGIINEINNASVLVEIKGKIVQYLKSDLSLVNHSVSKIKEIGEKINKLFNLALDELDRQILDFYSRKFDFSERQLERLEQVWRSYN